MLPLCKALPHTFVMREILGFPAGTRLPLPSNSSAATSRWEGDSLSQRRRKSAVGNQNAAPEKGEEKRKSNYTSTGTETGICKCQKDS